MRLWDNIHRYFAFKMKELEFRLHSRRRAKEISRAYDTPQPKVKTVGPKPHFGIKSRAVKAKIDFGAVKPLAIKVAKAVGAIIAAILIVFAVVKVVPFLSSPSSAAPKSFAVAVGTVGDTARDITRHMHTELLQEVPEGVEVPEAAVLPEGYATVRTAAVNGADAPPPVSPVSGRPIVDIFKIGLPRMVSLTEWLLLVDKSAKIIYLFRDTPDGWEVTRAFEVATGERAGRKEVEGDKKTPHGEYFIVGRKHRSELTNLYGPAAFILDYPNADDRAARRTGHGIWVHGSERGNIPPLFTAGCVAVSNPDILELAAFLGNGIGVPVIIVSGTEGEAHLQAVDFQKLRERGEEVVRYHHQRQTEFELLVMDWKRSWESRNIEAYTEFYSPRTFRNGTQTWEVYREHKLRTFNGYSMINIEITNIALTELTPNYATVKFFQFYTNNLGHRHDNAKRIIFRKEQDYWKIHREIPFPKEELLL